MTTTNATPKVTPLYLEHLRLKAKLVEFAGWLMPVQYQGIMEEHQAVRTQAGIFDVSHMGEFEFTGPNALACLQKLTPNDVFALVDGQAQYSLLLNEKGTIIDDIIVYRIHAEKLILVVNAANVSKDWEWITEHNVAGAAVANVSDNFALLALQGPKAAEMLTPLTNIDLKTLATFHLKSGTIVSDFSCLVARTGYTGEDGFEIFCPPQAAPVIWRALLEQGAKPVGLGARDTLRLEMRYSLYGHELTEETNPLEAGLGWVVKLKARHQFIGQEALLKIKAEGLKRKLVGFKMLEKGIPRSGYSLLHAGKSVGQVTSGTFSPSLNIAVGLGYLPFALSGIETKFFVDIRGQLRQAEVVKTPFYKK